MATKEKSKDKKSNTASVGFEEKLWAAADKMRNNMDPAERYVGFEAEEEDDEAFQEKMSRLTQELSEQFAESKVLEDRMRKNLAGIGFGL